MESEMATRTSIPNFSSFKCGDLCVYSQVYGCKDHIKTTLDITELLNHYDVEFMTFSCQLSPNVQTHLSTEYVSERSVLSVILLLSIDLLSVVWIVTVFSFTNYEDA